MSSGRCFGFGVSFFGVGEPAASAIAGRFSGLCAAWLVVDCFFCVILLPRRLGLLADAAVRDGGES